MAEANSGKSSIEILNQSETQARLYQLITEAERYIYLVSPYVHLDKLRTLVRHLQGALSKGVKMKLVVREKDASGNEDVLTSAQLPPLRQAGLEVLVLKDLHAKIYVSEKHALLTSLNLLETSFANSIEIGTWIPAGLPEYEKVIGFLKNEISPTASKVTALPEPPVLAPPTKAKEPGGAKRNSRAAVPLDLKEVLGDGDEGYCIRCGNEQEFNPDKPLCRECYGIWKQYGDADYPEKYCHACGEAKRTSVAKPLCRPCFDDLPGDDEIPF